MNDEIHPIVLFDGICNLCSGAVQFVIKYDKKRLFRFASLQSAFGQGVMQQFELPATELNSFILLKDDKIYTKSTGALMILKKLNGLLPLAYSFVVVPKFIRDAVYNFVATHRYKWFGKKEACWIPTPALQELFIE